MLIMKTLQKHNNKTGIFFKIMLIAIAFITYQCDSFVDVDLPDSQLSSPTVFADLATANAAMTSVYASIRDNGLLTGTPFGLSNNLGTYTDELDFYGDASFPAFYFYNNTLLPSNPQIESYWNTSYNQIYGANAIIEGVTDSSSLLEVDSNRLKGEALLVRALLHFYLMNLYGDIPYITSTDYTINGNAPRASEEDLYNSLILDLDVAQNLLPDAYYGSSRSHPNKSTVLALKARIYLYREMWTTAEMVSSQVIDNPMYADQSNLELIFLNDCTETIWQLPPAIEGMNTYEAETFHILSAPPLNSALTQNLISAFTDTDLRKDFWIGEISDGTNSWYYPNKYKQYGFESLSSEYSVIFRLAEQYLIRAEARAMQGNLDGAKEDLNKTRVRAGIGETTATNQTDLIDAIFKERRMELFTEFGHRFFDLKRSNQLDTVLQSIKPNWNSTDRLFPIPQSELSANPNLLPQNPGY